MYYKNFTPDGFVQKYTQFVKDMQNMPSAPYIMLVSPIYTASSVIAQKSSNFLFAPIYDKPYNIA